MNVFVSSQHTLLSFKSDAKEKKLLAPEQGTEQVGNFFSPERYSLYGLVYL
jgi:hypothetical protein